MPSLRHLAWSALTIVASIALAPPPSHGQQPSRHVTSPFLPSSHWAVAVTRRLAALDLVDADFGWGDGSLTILAVGRALHDAPAIAQREHRELEPLARGYWQRFAHEFPLTAATLDPRVSSKNRDVAEGWASVGYSSATGRVYPVRSLNRSREDVAGPFPRSDLSEAAFSSNLSFTVGAHLAGSLTPEHRDGDWGLREGYALVGWKKIGIWGGRRAPSFATGAGGGIVLNGTAAFTGGGVAFTEPFRLPWILRHVGAIRFESFLSKLDSNAAIAEPWFLGTHVSISPHPRLLIGGTQAYMFGGDGVTPITWSTVWSMLRSHGIIAAGSEFENGLASWEVRFRPPVPLVPLALYMEWGTDDNHSAWTLFPARVIGAQIAAMPGVPELSIGVEHSYFSSPCDGCKYYATWYRHYLFKDGWTVDRQPIGHPLGGDGTEWLLYGSWDDPFSRFRFDARSFIRERGAFNIYAPEREGRSIGGKISAVYRATPNMDLLFTGALEDGEADWRQSSVFAGLRWIF